jgi:hypothetical protein
VLDAYSSETTATSGVYAVMMCYINKGSGKSDYQDVTSKFIDGEDHIYAFSYGTDSLDKLKVGNVIFLRRDKDKSSLPSRQGYNSGSEFSGVKIYSTSMLYNL